MQSISNFSIIRKEDKMPVCSFHMWKKKIQMNCAQIWYCTAKSKSYNRSNNMP